MKRPTRSSCRGSSGFVLVGVVMMVLALTILGLSLFSLSSYEAQFMNRSLDSDQALQCALGGVDRARFVLASPADTGLGTVKIGFGDSVIWVRASQPGRTGITPMPPDSFGPIQWGGNDIIIEAVARYRGTIRRVQGSYHATQSNNYYRRLLTIVEGIRVNDDVVQNPNPPYNQLGLCGSVRLDGRVWEGAAPSDSSVWVGCVGTANYVPGIFCDSAPPMPDVSQFISAHEGLAIQPYISNPGTVVPTYRLWGTQDQVTYWTSNSGADFSVEEPAGTPTISVNGRAVWLLRRGLLFRHTVKIVSGGDPNACLVIVGGLGNDPNGGAGRWEDPGIWFNDGLQADIPVIFVSDQRVLVDRFYSLLLPFPTYADNISIFARNTFLSGAALALLGRLRLGYGPAMESQIDFLTARDALPNANGRAPLTLAPGTWRASQ